MKEKTKAILKTKISDLGFNRRIENALRSAKIYTVLDLAKTPWLDIRRIRNLGGASLRDIDDFLQKHNLEFGMRDLTINENEHTISSINDILKIINRNNVKGFLKDFENFLWSYINLSELGKSVCRAENFSEKIAELELVEFIWDDDGENNLEVHISQNTTEENKQ